MMTPYGILICVVIHSSIIPATQSYNGQQVMRNRAPISEAAPGPLNEQPITTSKMEEYFRWKQIDLEGLEKEGTTATGFLYPSAVEAIAANNFTPYNNVPLGVDYYNGRLFITIPRRQYGIPVTLAYVNVPKASDSPKLIPYPDFSTNVLSSEPDASKIVSVYRTRIDKCGRLWFVDTGMFEPPG